MAEEPDPREPDARAEATAVLAYALFCVALLLFAAGLVVHQWRASVGIDREGAMSVLLVSSVFTAALGVVLTLLLIRRWPRRRERERVPLCAHCYRPHLEEVHFCPTCSRPLTVFAATASYENVYAQMWGIGKALQFPSRLLHPIGITLVTLPWLAYVLLLFSPLLQEGWGPVASIFDFVWSLLHALVYYIVLRMAWGRWLRRRRDPEAAPPEATYGHAPWWTYDRTWDIAVADDDGGPDPGDPEVLVSSG